MASDFPCVNCGSLDHSVLRKDETNPRLKCNNCNLVYSGVDSRNAEKAGAIKPSSSESLASATEPELEEIHIDATDKGNKRFVLSDTLPIQSEVGSYDFPKAPSYVFLAKDKTKYQFCSKRDFKKVAVRWSQGGSFDVYSLTKVKLNVKVDIQ